MKQISKKLNLKKSTIANLDQIELKNVKGGMQVSVAHINCSSIQCVVAGIFSEAVCL